jgi:hypothetical protein
MSYHVIFFRKYKYEMVNKNVPVFGIGTTVAVLYFVNAYKNEFTCLAL